MIDGPRRPRMEWTPAAPVGAGRRSFLLCLLVAALAALVLPACQSPTLPLPPPSRPDVTAPDDAGLIRISGRIQPYSIVLAENARTSEIVGKETGDSGEYSLEMRAEVDDVVEVWEVYKTEQSQRVIVVVPSREDLGAAGASND